MTNSHAAGWGNNPPSPAQLKELFSQIESGQMSGPRLQRVLNQPRFPTWKTLSLRNFSSTSDCLRAFRSAGFTSSGDAETFLEGIEDILRTMDIYRLEFVRVFTAEFGIKQNCRIKDVFKRAEEFGLYLCPITTAPILRLNYPEQPIGEMLRIAMRPILLARNDERHVFTLEHNAGNGMPGKSLSTYYGDIQYEVRPDQEWVFCHLPAN